MSILDSSTGDGMVNCRSRIRIRAEKLSQEALSQEALSQGASSQ
jgi:hypothetical protein